MAKRKPKVELGEERLAGIPVERRRRIYLSRRVPELLQELKTLGEDVTKLAQKIKDPGAEKVKPSENMEDLLYLTERRAALLNEVEALRKERKTLANRSV